MPLTAPVMFRTDNIGSLNLQPHLVIESETFRARTTLSSRCTCLSDSATRCLADVCVVHLQSRTWGSRKRSTILCTMQGTSSVLQVLNLSLFVLFETSTNVFLFVREHQAKKTSKEGTCVSNTLTSWVFPVLPSSSPQAAMSHSSSRVQRRWPSSHMLKPQESRVLQNKAR